MFIDKETLIKLDDDSKDLIITGEFALYQTDIEEEDIKYVIETDEHNYFGIDAVGVIKKHFVDLAKPRLIERIFLRGKLTHAISMNVNF